MLLEQPHRLRVDRLATDADGGRRPEEIEEALASVPPAAGLDERGRLVPAAVACRPKVRQGYFLFGFFFAFAPAAAFAFGRAFGFAFATAFFATGRSTRATGAGW